MSKRTVRPVGQRFLRMFSLLVVFGAVLAPAVVKSQGSAAKTKPIPTVSNPPNKDNTPTDKALSEARSAAKDWVSKRSANNNWRITGWDFQGDINGPVTKGRTWKTYRMRVSPPVELGHELQRELFFYFDGHELAYPGEKWPDDLPNPGSLNVAVMNVFDEVLQRDPRKRIGTPKR